MEPRKENPEMTTKNPTAEDVRDLVEAAGNALNSLEMFIEQDSDPGSQAFGDRYRLRQVLMRFGRTAGEGSTDDQGTSYHASVDDFRRCLAKAYLQWGQDREKYGKLVYPSRREDGGKPTDAERDAYAASMMAASYAYTLAAVIKLAGQDFGQEVALALANEADNLLMNGDDDPGWNADVIPSPEAWTCGC
jgi:hypothetical protein